LGSFGARLAVAVAERLSLSYLQVWRDRPISGVSHPKEFRRIRPLEMLARPIGATLIIDDVADSSFHMEGRRRRCARSESRQSAAMKSQPGPPMTRRRKAGDGLMGLFYLHGMCRLLM
jgi:hypothetical protein